MGRIIFSIIICLCFQASAKSQYYYYNQKYYDKDLLFEFGITSGIMNGITDLGDRTTKNRFSDLSLKDGKLVAGIFFSAIYKEKIALRLQFLSGGLEAADSSLEGIKEKVRGRYERNLSFKTRINELQLTTEFYPLNFLSGQTNHKFNPYVLSGIGLYVFEPKASLNGIWYSLQPLKTEGQGFAEYPDRKIYQLTQFNISLGTGIRYELNPLFNLGIEFNYRLLFTDYLDDASTSYIDRSLFSRYLPANQAAIAGKLADRRRTGPADQFADGGQRGNPARNDAYYSLVFKAGVLLGRHRR